MEQMAALVVDLTECSHQKEINLMEFSSNFIFHMKKRLLRTGCGSALQTNTEVPHLVLL